MGSICQHASPPRHLRLFYELCAYISLGVHWKVYFRRVLHIPRRQGIQPLSGICISRQVSWRCGMAAGWRAWPNGLPVGIARTWPGCSRGHVRPGPPWPSGCGPPDPARLAHHRGPRGPRPGRAQQDRDAALGRLGHAGNSRMDDTRPDTGTGRSHVKWRVVGVRLPVPRL